MDETLSKYLTILQIRAIVKCSCSKVHFHILLLRVPENIGNQGPPPGWSLRGAPKGTAPGVPRSLKNLGKLYGENSKTTWNKLVEHMAGGLLVQGVWIPTRPTHRWTKHRKSHVIFAAKQLVVFFVHPLVCFQTFRNRTRELRPALDEPHAGVLQLQIC